MGLHQLVTQSTMINKERILDLVLTSQPSPVTQCEVIDFALCTNDHLGISFSLEFQNKNTNVRTKYFDFCNGNYPLLNSFFSRINWDAILSSFEDLDLALNCLYEIIWEGIRLYVPQISPSEKKLKYPMKIQNLLRKKRNLWQNRGNPLDKTKYQQIEKKCRKEIHKFQENRLLKSLGNGGVQSLFKFFKKRKKGNLQYPTLELNGSHYIDPKEKCDIFSRIFQENFLENTHPFPEIKNRDSHFQFYFDALDIFEILEKLPSKLSTGPDKIPQYLLKNCAASLTYPLFHLFTRSMQTSYIPREWKKAHVRPIFKKKGSPNDPTKYRPISLTSTLCRSFESVIAKYLYRHLIRKGVLAKEQYGFLPRKSCVAQLLTVLKDWTDVLSDRKNVDVIYFDFEKAFDRVNHSLLLEKLIRYDVDAKVISWIGQFLKDRSYEVIADETLSDPFFTHSGVPQGSVLGPILFLIFINDLPNVNFKIAKIKLFADDLKLYATVNSIQDANNLQEDINKVSAWASENNFTLACDKTSLLRLGNKPLPFNYKLQDRTIEPVSQVRDLGIIIDSKLSFEEHINEIASKSSRRIYHLVNSLPKLTIDLYVRLYKAYVLPVLEYGSVLFSPTLKGQIKRLEKPQKLFTKILAHKHLIPNSDYRGRLKALKMDSLEFRRIIIDLSYVYKILFGIVNIESSRLFSFPTRLNTRLSHGLRLSQPMKTPKNAGFLPCRVTHIWNDLPICFNNEHSHCSHGPQPDITMHEQFKSWLESIPKSQINYKPVYEY